MILQAISLASIDGSIQEYEEKTNIHLQKPEKRLKECLEEAALSTTAHGFEKIISHKKFSLKLIWILLLLASVGVCIYFVVKSVADYLDYEVVTKIQSFYELPVLFPTVTICNVNMYNNKQSIEFAKRKIAENRIKDSFDGDEFGPGVTPYNFALNIKYMASAYFRNLTTDELKYYGSKYNETFISCSFSLSTCDETYFEWLYDIYYGSCWRFNPKNLSIGQIYTYRPGPLLGLRVEVFVPEIEDPFAFANDRGVIVFVQNASDTKLPSTAVGVKAQVGTETNVQIGRQFISKLESPYSSCVNLESSGSKLYKVFVDMGLEYTQFACFDLCYQYEVLKKCGCIDSTYIQLPGQPVCMNFSQTICNTNTFIAFYDRDHLTKCDCPLECDSQTFPLTVSSSSYPTRALANQIVNHTGYELANFFPNVSTVTYEDLKSHTLCLNFYYGDMNYIYIQELAKIGFFDLISSIGGLLGLFIGTSFLSFFELVDVFLRFLYSEFEYKKAKKKARRLNKV